VFIDYLKSIYFLNLTKVQRQFASFRFYKKIETRVRKKSSLFNLLRNTLSVFELNF